jgi:hypothetical protein
MVFNLQCMKFQYMNVTKCLHVEIQEFQIYVVFKINVDQTSVLGEMYQATKSTILYVHVSVNNTTVQIKTNTSYVSQYMCLPNVLCAKMICMSRIGLFILVLMHTTNSIITRIG